jgi:CRP-like cAMP-binding protein
VSAFVDRNVLLTGLPNDVLARIELQLRVRELCRGEVLYSGLALEEIQHVYFPVSAVLSMGTVLSDGETVEALPVGFEGLAGFQVICGSVRMYEQWICSIPGTVVEMRVEHFWELLNACASFGQVLLCYSQALITALAVSVACNAKHTVPQRYAKWLLLTHDRVRAEDFPMTHEMLSGLLGVRRAGISTAAGGFQNDGSIEYGRGRIRIRDRAALERHSCECYANVSGEFERLMARANGAFGSKTPTQLP